MSIPTSPTFELEGIFSGFVRTLQGKRRMRLQVEGAELLLKVPKALREQLFQTLAPGQLVIVNGVEERGRFSDKMKRVVTGVRGPAADGQGTSCLTSSIRICTKKNCWRAGGKELWEALEHELKTNDLTSSLRLKGVDCLDNCKRGPNALWGRHFYQRVSSNEASEIVRKITRELGLERKSAEQPGHDTD